MRSKKHLFYSILVIAAGLLAGCGSKGNGGALTRSEYIGMLGQEFGYMQAASDSAIFPDVTSSDPSYTQIQACAEWDVIDRDGSFGPDDKVTLDYALSTAVKAIGLNYIEGNGANVSEDKLPEFFAGNIAQIDISNLNASVDAQTAQMILDCAYEYKRNLTLPQVYEYTYNEGVKEATPGISLNPDGLTGHIADGSGYEVGDIVYFDASDNSVAKAVRITAINGDTFDYVPASQEDVFQDLVVSGTYVGNVSSAVSATTSGYDQYAKLNDFLMAQGDYPYYAVSMTDGMDDIADYQLASGSLSLKDESGTGVKVTVKDNSVCFSGSIPIDSFKNEGTLLTRSTTYEEKGTAEFSIEIKDIMVTTDYEWHLFGDKRAVVNLDYDVVTKWGLKGVCNYTVNLGKFVIPIAGPVTVDVGVDLVIGLEGEISVVVTTENHVEAGYKSGTGLFRKCESESSVDFEAKVKLTAGPRLFAELTVLGGGIINVSVESGICAEAKVDASLLGDDPDCIDIVAYVPLKFGVNQKGCLVTTLFSEAKLEIVIWDSKSSPFKFGPLHFESTGIDDPFHRVEKCTRGQAVESSLEDENGNALDLWDYPEFTFEPYVWDFIELNTYVVFLNEGDSTDLGFNSIPNEYTASDLIYEVEDPSVCSVSGGRITANKIGTTLITIRTPDDMATAVVGVVINPSVTVDGFEPL